MAIAFDAATNGNFTSSTSHTFSHTCTGSDRLLIVEVVINTDTDLVTGVTYAGVSLTRLATVAPTVNRRIYLYYLVAPSTGANNVVLTASSSTALGGNSASYTGVNQTTPFDVSTTNTGTSSPVTTTLTTTVDNDWAVLLTTMDNTVVISASTGSTLRTSNTTYVDTRIFDSSTNLTPTGSKSMLVTSGTMTTMGTIMAAFSPSVAATTPSRLMMMGVG